MTRSRRTVPRNPLRVEGLIALAQALNGPTRAALSSLRAGGNRPGAESVLTWQTGYPFAVDHSRGYPRYMPGDRGLDRLARGGFTAALVVGSPVSGWRSGSGSGRYRHGGDRPRASQAPFPTRVAIDTGVAGIHEGGTAYRMDEVPLSLRPPLDRSALGGADPRGTHGGGADQAPRKERMTARLRIAGGTVHDPANGIDGEVRDICIEDGRIVAEPARRRTHARRPGNDRDGGRGGHPLAPRQLQLQSCAPVAAGGALGRPSARPRPRRWSRPGPVRHRRHRPHDLHHRLPLRRSGVHHCLRRRRGSGHGAAQPCRAGGHALRGRRVLRADGQRRVPAAADRRRRAGAGSRLRRLAAWARPGPTPSRS